MKLLAGSRRELAACTDTAFGADASIVCRYRNAFRHHDSGERDLAFRRHLLENSLREGVRVVPLLTYRGVAIHVLDESSGMETGSLKSIDGCLTASLCRLEGVGRIAFESGGNSGSALTRYGRNAGLETFFFCPRGNLDLLDSRLFFDPESHLVAIRERERVKELTALFSKTAGIRQVPDRSLRYAAAMFRGAFILEHMIREGPFDWFSQAISAAFGPIGIYKVLAAFPDEIRGVPRFLGVQQEANCPMYRAWNPVAAERLGKPGQRQDRLLTRIMYDGAPETHETLGDLLRLLRSTRGDLLTVGEAEFDACIDRPREYGSLLEALGARGISISLRAGQIVDKAGLLALAGTLKGIDSGLIPSGASVLCALTGGVSRSDGLAGPEATLGEPGEVEDYVEAVRKGR